MSNKTAHKNSIDNDTKLLEDKQVLSVSEAAAILKISPTSLRRLEQENKIKSIRQPNGYRIFKLEEVLSLQILLENEKKQRQYRQPSLPVQTPLAADIKSNAKEQEKTITENIPAIPAKDKSLIQENTQSKSLFKFTNREELKALRKPVLAATVMTILLMGGMFLTQNLPGKDILGKFSVGNFLGLKNTDKGSVLSDRDLNANLIFNVNIPAIFKANTTVEQNLTVNGNLSVDQLSTLSGGLTTNNADGDFGTGTITVGIVNFVGAASLNNLAAINEITETTLEEALDIDGDVTSTGMNNTVVSAINGAPLGNTDATDSNILMVVDGKWTSTSQTEITSLGTITEGVWEGDPIAPEFGGLGITSFVTGDLIFADTNSTWATMNVGGTGYILTSNGTTPEWAPPSSLIADAWLLSGNTGTNPNLNFIGTTDSTSLSLRTNSVDRLRITENGFIGIGNTTPSVEVHLGNGSTTPTYISGVPESQYIEGDLEVAGTIYGSLIGVITTTGFDPNGIFFADATGTMVNDNTQITWNPTDENFTVNGTTLLNGLASLSDGLSVTGPVNATGVINLGNGANSITINGSTLTFNDNLSGPITFTGADGSFTSGDTAIVDAINAAYEAATGSGDGLWAVRSGALYPSNVVQDLAVGDSSSNAPFFFDTSENILILTNSTTGDSFRVNDQASDTTPFIIDATGDVGIGTTNPTYKLEVIGDARLSNGSDLIIGTIGLNDNGVSNVSSGASLIGVFDEFTWSTGGTVQQVLNDLDAQIATVAGDTHPALSLNGTSNYLTLNAGTQVLTQNAIDLSNANNTTGTLLSSRGGLGFDASTAPAGSLLLGTGTGLNIRTMGGDATVASNGTLTLANSGVAAGTYGSTLGIPVLTVDAKGRIISASTAAANFEQTLTFSNPLTRTGNVVSVDIVTSGATATTASNSGLEIASDGLRLIGGCAANEILAWDAGANRWRCTSASGIGGVTGTGVNGRLTFWNGTNSVASSQSLYWDNAQGRLAIGNSSPNYSLDVTGDIFATNIRAGTNLLVGGTALSSSSSVAGSGAYMIGVFDEFTYSNSTNLQAVLNDLDAQISTAAGGTHPALQLAGSATYLSLNAGSQILTQSAIDLTNTLNTSGALLTSRGGLGIDASTAPAGTLAIGNGTGFNIRAIGGDATLASNGTLTLSNTGVLAGTYGSSTGIPVIQIDARGRIISATTSPVNAAIDGTGLANYIARFTDQNTLDIGTLYDNGSQIGLGTTNPSQSLDVAGAIRLGTAGLNNVLNTSAMGGAPTGNLFWGNRVLTDSSNVSNYAITSFSAGNGLTTTGTGPGSVSLALDVTTSGVTSTTASNSGLEIASDGLRLIGGCASNEVMVWDAVRQVWKCSSVSGVGAITGGGATGQVAFWDSTSNLNGSDAFFWETATSSLGLGTTNPDSTLTISPATAAALQINAYGAGAGNTGELRFLELSGNGSNYTGFKSPDNLTQNIVYTLPSTTAPSDYILTYQSGGALQWKEITGVGAAGDITQVGSMTTSAVFADAGADDQWLGLGAAGGRIEFDDQTTDEINILDARLGVGTTAPQYALDVNGDVRGVNLRADTALIVGGTSIASAGVNNVTSGASLIGAFDEFTNSNGTTVQAVLRDLDSYVGSVAGNTHPALQLAGTATYLSLDAANQILTQGAIDLTDANNTSGSLLTSRGGLGLDASTAPAGSLILGTGTGLNIRTMGGDATIASNGTLTLSSTGVAAGTYGSAYGIPVIQVDARGRIISASTIAANFEQTLTFSNPLTRTGNTISLDVVTTGVTTTTASNSGLEIASDGLRLLGGCAANEVLAWDAGANRWHCSSVTGVGAVSGTGTTNYLTKWSGTNSLTSGVLYDDGTRIGLGTTNPTDMFHLVSSSNPSISLTNTAYGTTGSLFNDGNLHLSGGGNLWLDGGEVYLNSGNTYHVTVGSTVANARLDIKGLGTTDGLAFAIKDSNSLYTFGIQDNGYVGVGTTDPDYALDVVGTIAASNSLMVGGTALSANISNAGSGAYMIGVFDEFNNSDATNVQAVLNDLDNYIGGVAGNTHPAIQLAGTANYLSLNTGTQVLTQNAIDLTNASNTSGALLTSRGGLGVDASTAPAGTLVIGTGTGFNIRAMGGDATIASNGTLTLANTGVSAATYGSALGIPVVQVDAKGRIISASTVAANFEQTLTFSNPLTRTGNTIGLDVTTTGTTTTTAANSGLEVGSDGLRLLGGCADNEVLAWDGGANRWACTSTTGIGAVTGSGNVGQLAFWNSTTDLTSSANLYWNDALGRLGIGNASPDYTLDVTGDVFATNIRAATNLIVGGTALSSSTSVAGSGAYMIGVFDEFTYSNASNVQGVLNDLDSYIGGIAGNTHPALQLAGTANYLSLNAGSQVLTQSAIDLTNTNNTSGALLTSRGGLGVDASTAPAGTLAIGTGSGFNIRAVGGDATLASNGTLTLATVNANTGTFGSSTSIPVINIDGKGRIISASTASLTNILDGSGSLNYVAKFTDSNTLTTSGIYEINGRVGIGTTAPQTALNIESTSASDFLIGQVQNVAGNGRLTLGYDASENLAKIQASRVSSATPALILQGIGGNVGIGTTATSYTLDVGGDIRGTNVRGAALIVGGTSLASFSGNRASGAYMIGVNDEFDFSNNTNVQAVLNDLDANFANYSLAANTHPALQLAGAANYLSLNGSQVLTQGAIDLTNTNNTSGALLTSRGGLGVDASTAPAGTLAIGTGTGFNIRAMGGDATLASNGTLTLANTGVSAATYGSALGIPVIQVDAKGRIISASTALANFEQTLTFSNPLTRSGTTISLDVATTGTTTTTASNSGLEIGSDGLRLLGGCASNEVLAWDSGANRWRCSSISGVGAVDGSGSANYVARWSDANTLTTGALYDNGTQVGIGTTNPSQALEVSGTLEISNSGTIRVGGATRIGATGNFYSANGTTTIPGYSFSGDTDTGIYRPALDSLGFVLGGNELVKINSSGYIGIGLTNPTYSLDTTGDIRAVNIRATTDLIVGGTALSSTTSNAGSGAYMIGAYDEFAFSNSTNVQAVLNDLDANFVNYALAANTHPALQLAGSANYLSLNGSQVLTQGAIDLTNTNNTSGALLTSRGGLGVDASTAPAGTLILGTGTGLNIRAMGGDATIASNGTLTLATVNVDTGTYGSALGIPVINIDGKGRIISASTALANFEQTLSFSNPLVRSGNSISLDVVTTGVTTTTASNSGLEIGSDGLRLLGGCATNEVLSWDAGANRWRCSSVSGVGGVTGSGANGQVSFWTSTSNLSGTDSFFWENGSNSLGLGTTNPSATLTITPTDSSALQINPFGAGAGNTGELRFSELTANGSSYTGFKSPDSLPQNIVYTLPSATSPADYVLTFQNNGLLQWKEITGVGAAGDITAVGSMTSGIAFGDATADDDWLGLGATEGRIEFDDQTTDEVNILNARLGINTQTPQYLLDVNGDMRATNVNATALIVGGTSLASTSSNAGSGAYMIGVYDEFTNSTSTNVQGVLRDLDAALGSLGAGVTHPDLQLAGTATYLTLNGTQVLTQNAIDLTNTLNTTGALLTSRGGTGIDASTAPAGTLLLGTGTGFNVRAMGGDATIASNGTLTLANTGVSAATYGSALGIPVIQVDAKGRIISASTALANFEQTLTFSNPLVRSGNSISLDVVTTGVTTTTASNSGLEIGSDGLRLLGGCASNEVLAWDAGANRWRCTSISGVGAIDGSGAANYVARWSDANTLTTGALYDNGTQVGIGTTDPNTTLDVAGDISGTNLRATTNLIVGGTALSSTSGNRASGAYMIGVNDEFTFSSNTNVQAVLNDLDANFVNYALASGTHPALQLAGTANYLSLNGSQVLTQGAIDLTNTNNTSGALLTSRGGLGVDASTAPAGTLAIGTGTGFNIRTVGGDATLASNGTLTLANTGVSAATYGSALGIPVLNIDAKGRIISASTALANFEQTLSFSNPLVRTGNAISLDVTTTGTTTTTASNSGLEIGSDGLRLLGGCASNEVLAWDAGANRWRCSSISGVGGLDGSGTANYVARWSDANTLTTGTLYDNGSQVGIGTTAPFYDLDVAGDIRGINLRASTNLIVGGTALSATASNAGSGAYMIGAFDEFTYSNSTNVQAVLNDLDANFVNYALAANTHPALQLAGTANYLSLNAGTQVLTQSAIDLTNTSNTSGALLTSRGGLGVDASTAPAGTLVIGTGTGLNIRTMGGDATIASNGTLTLANTGVSAATYGSALGIPVLNIDAKGRIISASTALANFEQTLTFSNPLSRTGNTIGLDVTTTSTTTTTASNSGLEIGTDGLRLLGGCSANQVLSWDAGANRWRCVSPTTGTLTGSGVAGRIAFFDTTSNLATNQDFYWDNANSRLGIGTSSPSQKLYVYESRNGAVGAYVENPSTEGSAQARFSARSATSQLTFSAYPDTYTAVPAFADRVGMFGESSAAGINIAAFNAIGDIRFFTGGSAEDDERLRIDYLGNVGIGTTNPQYPLHVAGDIYGTNLRAATNLIVGSTALSATTSNAGSGAYLIGTFDEFTYSNSTNVQAVLNDLDAQLGTLAGGVTHPALQLAGAANYLSLNGTQVLTQGAIDLTNTNNTSGALLTSRGGLGVDASTAPAGSIILGTGTGLNIRTMGGHATIASNGTLTLANSGVSAATYGSALGIPVITVDATGRITSASTAAANFEQTLTFSNPLTRTGNTISLDATTTGTTATTASNSGIEVGTDGLRLLGGCSDNQVLAWDAARGVWKCATGSSSGLWTDGGGVTYLTELSESLAIGGTTASDAPFFFSVPNEALTLTSTQAADIFRINDEANDLTPFLVDADGQVGIGNTSPATALHVISTTEQLRLGYDATNFTSFTVGSNGDLTISVNGVDSARFGSVNNEIYLPTTFSAAGDVSFAYDAIFTNQTASKIETNGPFTIDVGEAFENNNLTIKTYGTGDAIFNTGGDVLLQYADPTLVFDTLSGTDTDFWMGVVENSDSTNNDLFVIGTGTQQGSGEYFAINSAGLVGIGTTSPLYMLDVAGNIRGTTASLGYINIGGEMIGDFVGQGLVTSGTSLQVNLTTSGVGSSTASNSGMELSSAGLRLLGGCSDDQMLTWDAGANRWQCSTAATGIAGTGVNGRITFWNGASSLASSQDLFWDNSNGRLGIGTSSPSDTIDVEGTGTIGFTLNRSGVEGRLYNDGNLHLSGGGNNLWLDGGNIYLNSGNTNRVSLGSSTPNATFDIKGAGTTTGLAFAVKDSSDLYTFSIQDNGFVGIGTTDPASELELNGTLTMIQPGYEANSGELSFEGWNGGGWFRMVAEGTDSNNNNVLFEVRDIYNPIFTVSGTDYYSAFNYSLYVADNFQVGPTGNLFVNALNDQTGIGTTEPDSKLHIVGGDLYAAADSGYTFNNAGTNNDIYAQGNLEVDGTIYGTTASVNQINIGGESIGDFAGQGLIMSGTALTVDVTTTGTTSTTASNSGLELTAGGVRMLGGCSDGQILTWDAGANRWQCTTNTAGTSNWTDGGGTTYLTSLSDSFALGGTTASDAPFYYSVPNQALTLTSTGTADIFRVNDASGDTTPFLVDADGQVGIGNTNPVAGLHVIGTTEQLRLGYDASNYSSFTIGSDGDLTLSVNGVNTARFGSVNNEIYLPTTFSAAGDVSFAYDALFTNQTASMIKSYGPLTIENGDSYESNNLTLRTFNYGNVVVEPGASLMVAHTSPSFIFDSINALDTDFWAGVITDNDGNNDDTLSIGYGSTVGSNRALNLNNKGYLGIGVTTPAAYLDLVGSSTAAASMRIRTGVQPTNPVTGDIYSDGTNVYFYDGDSWEGMVGVGSTAVSSLFTDGGGTTYLTATSDSFALGGTTASNAPFFFSVPNELLTLTGDTGEQLRLAYDSSNYSDFTVGSNGDLILSVNGTNSARFGSVNNEFYLPTTFSASGDASFGNDIVLTNQTASQIETYGPLSIIAGDFYESNNLTLKTYNSGDVVLDLGRSLLLTNSAPGQVFDITTSGDQDFWFGTMTNSTGTTAADMISIGTGSTLGTTPRLTVNSNGNIGVGTTTPTVALHVIGNGRFTAVGSGTFSNNLNITSDGTLTTATSDIRLKTDIEEMTNTLEKVLQLNPVSFTWKNDELHRTDLGLIAQEVDVLFPEITFTNPTDGYMGINYTKLTPVLVAAMQELDMKIDGMNGDIENVEALLTGTTAPLADIQTTVNTLTGEVAGVKDEVTSLRDEITALKELINSGNETSESTQSVEIVLDEVTETTQSTETTESVDMALTPGDILLEMQKLYDKFVSLFENLNISATEDSGLLVNADMNVLGDTTLNNVTITGDLTAGLIKVNTLENSIDVMGVPCYDEETCNSQTLYVQKGLSGNVDFLDGAVVIAADGTLNVEGGIRANTVTAEEFQVMGASKLIGSATIEAGETEVTVTSEKVKADSKIFVTATSQTGGQALIVTEKNEGTSFTVAIETTTGNDVNFDWWILNVE